MKQVVMEFEDSVYEALEQMAQLSTNRDIGTMLAKLLTQTVIMAAFDPERLAILQPDEAKMEQYEQFLENMRKPEEEGE